VLTGGSGRSPRRRRHHGDVTVSPWTLGARALAAAPSRHTRLAARKVKDRHRIPVMSKRTSGTSTSSCMPAARNTGCIRLGTRARSHVRRPRAVGPPSRRRAESHYSLSCTHAAAPGIRPGGGRRRSGRLGTIRLGTACAASRQTVLPGRSSWGADRGAKYRQREPIRASRS
jgi:hypothetical protein